MVEFRGVIAFLSQLLALVLVHKGGIDSHAMISLQTFLQGQGEYSDCRQAIEGRIHMNNAFSDSVHNQRNSSFPKLCVTFRRLALLPPPQCRAYMSCQSSLSPEFLACEGTKGTLLIVMKDFCVRSVS